MLWQKSATARVVPSGRGGPWERPTMTKVRLTQEPGDRGDGAALASSRAAARRLGVEDREGAAADIALALVKQQVKPNAPPVRHRAALAVRIPTNLGTGSSLTWAPCPVHLGTTRSEATIRWSGCG